MRNPYENKFAIKVLKEKLNELKEQEQTEETKDKIIDLEFAVDFLE